MALITITVKDEGTDSPWQEKYDANQCVDPSSPLTRKPSERVRVRSQKAAEEWAGRLLIRFNETRRPGEPRRLLLAVAFDKDAEKED